MFISIFYVVVPEDVFLQMLLSKMNNLNKSIWPLDGNLISTTLGQKGSWNNDNEGVLYTPQISRTEASPLNAV